MFGGLNCKGQVGSVLRSARSSRLRNTVAHSGSGDGPSSSGRDLSCSGGPVGFGTLRKGFKPQPKRSQQAPPKVPTFNGRDKADVLRDTQAEVALKAAQAQAVNASAATASAEGSATSNDDIWADWRRVDSKVNKYPTQRLFTAVGSGGDEFREAMIRCVVEVVGGPVDVDVRPSSGGNYQSVRVGPVTVNNPDQVLEIFTKMRQDKRLKFHL